MSILTNFSDTVTIEQASAGMIYRIRRARAVLGLSAPKRKAKPSPIFIPQASQSQKRRAVRRVKGGRP